MPAARLLNGVRPDRALTHAEHLQVHGPLGECDLAARADEAGVRGRGGGGFPAGRKLRSVAEAHGRHATVLVNAAEGDPLSGKDRVLCALAPHLVLDGAVAAAHAVGARDIVVALPATAAPALDAMRLAVAERGSDSVTVRVVPVPAAYLAGEESALIRYLDGGALKPTLVPPRPAERGLRRHPTLVNNPETLAHLALVARHGAAWFRAAGTEADPGTALVTLGGAVTAPGVREIDLGTRLTTLLGRSDAITEDLRAVLVGGLHGAWIDARMVPEVTLDDHHLARFDTALGAGSIVALGVSACPVQELTQMTAWLSAHGAGQCGPCANGLPAMADLLSRIAAGQAPRDAPATLERWSIQIAGRGACHLPDGAARLVRSGLRVFAPEIKRHAHRGPCAACRRPTLLPTAERLAA